MNRLTRNSSLLFLYCFILFGVLAVSQIISIYKNNTVQASNGSLFNSFEFGNVIILSRDTENFTSETFDISTRHQSEGFKTYQKTVNVTDKVTTLVLNNTGGYFIYFDNYTSTQIMYENEFIFNVQVSENNPLNDSALSELIELLEKHENNKLDAFIELLTASGGSLDGLINQLEELDSDNVQSFINKLEQAQLKELLKQLSSSDDDTKSEEDVALHYDGNGHDVNKIVELLSESLNIDTTAEKLILQTKVETYINTGTATHDELKTILEDLTTTDIDQDSIPDIIEEVGPNNGDTNFDNVPDTQQPHVAAIPTARGKKQLTFESPASCTRIRRFTSSSTDSIGTNDPGYTYPYGLNRFELNCASATIRIFYHGVDDIETMSYRKRHSIEGKYVDLPVSYGEKNGTPYIEFTIEDGDEFDDSPAGDGWIIDDNGPAIEAEEEASSGGGTPSSVGSYNRGYGGGSNNNTSSSSSSSNDTTSDSTTTNTNNSASSNSQNTSNGSSSNTTNTTSLGQRVVGFYKETIKKFKTLYFRLRYRNSKIYEGNNLRLFEAITNTVEQVPEDEKVEKLKLIIRNLDKVDETTLEKYSIDKQAIKLLLSNRFGK